ncbi:cell wall-binding repeat-containing protein [Clostridium thermarum]|uniref:cell wall-binding repeat-containing protein n=1 Tax=Clostridium thermarum TaxID=1716543 RepID=UPI0013D7342B|nr:cell wall-binding repeat-containing protein [Clostridium thermarum]
MKNKILTGLSLFVSALVLLFNYKPVKVNAATSDRIWGQNRYQTASMIALNGWQTAKYAILVTGDNYPDALAATPLSKKYDAPILLTEKDKLTGETLNTLKKLKVTDVFIIGGTGVVSTSVYNSLTGHGMKVKRLAGSNRYETSLEVAKFIGVSKGVFVLNGSHFGDALIVGPVAANLGMPIILTDKKGLDPAVEKYLKSNNISKTYVIGDNSLVSDSVVNKLTNVERILGADIYARNNVLLKKFCNILDFSSAYIATGDNFPDALAGGALASKNCNPLILTSATPAENTLKIIKENNTSNLIALGGESVVQPKTLDKLMTQVSGVYEEGAHIQSSGPVNLRRYPRTDQPVLDEMNNGTAVTIIGKTDHWYKVRYNGETGYIAAQFVVPDSALRGFDCYYPLSLSQYEQFKAEGYSFAARYYSTEDPLKKLTKEEAQAASAAGLQIVAVYQDYNNKAELFNYQYGVLQCTKAIEQAIEVGQPASGEKPSTIYFAVDEKNTGDIPLNKVEEYFKGIMDTMEKFQAADPEKRRWDIGVYGNYRIVKHVKENVNPDIYVWQTSMGTGQEDYFSKYYKYNIYQNLHEVNHGSIQIDENYSNVGGDMGGFIIK